MKLKLTDEHEKIFASSTFDSSITPGLSSAIDACRHDRAALIEENAELLEALMGIVDELMDAEEIAGTAIAKGQKTTVLAPPHTFGPARYATKAEKIIKKECIEALEALDKPVKKKD